MGNTGQSITLANSIIGVGILAMPFCFQQCGVLLATLILILMGLVSRLCCHFLLKSAIITRRRNFEFLAFHVFGPSGKLAVELGIIGFLMGTCIAYFVVVGDLGPQIISKLFNINQSDILRTSIMVIVSLVCVLPLGLLRNVDSLSNVSAATIGFYFCLVIKVITEATSQLLTSDWHTRIEMWRPEGILQCVPIISMALFCQTQLFEIFESMPSLSLEKMNKVTKNAINICTAVYFTLGIFGYAAFGSQEISGNILMSLSPTMASDVIKLGFVMSLAFSFPLIIFPCRASLYSFLYRKPHSSQHDHIINHSIPERTFRAITVSIVCAALVASLLLPNVELVLGLLGSTVGVLVCVAFPAACFVRVTYKNTNERILAKVMIFLGLIILILGTYANLQAAENTKDKYDEKLITQDRINKIVEDFFENRDKVDGAINDKQQLAVDSLPKVEVVKVNGDSKKDSEVQPPNPVPPDSRSDEKNPVNPVKVPELIDESKLKEVKAPELVDESKLKEMKSPELIDESKLKEVLPEVVKNLAEKETPSKILQNILNEPKISNGVDTAKQQEKIKEPEKHSSQEKSDIQKQQKLIETIKQHGQEQKELIKEQKEILDEIKKTQKELKKDKAVDIEAKKIAVESIQKIANMAIQSLSGVTDKPIDNVDNVKEPIQKIAHEAVQEIARKAADAIKEIKDNKHVEEDTKLNSKDKVTSNNQVVNKDTPNIIPDSAPNNLPVVQANENNIPNNKIIGNPIAQSNDKNINQQDNVVPNIIQNNVQPNINIPSANIVNKLLEKKDQNGGKLLKEHLHSPDEPQSYKQGEDIQKNVNSETKPLNNGNQQNAPIPIVLRDNSNIDTQSVLNGNKVDTKHEPLDKVNVVIDKTNNNVNEIKNGAVEDTLKNNDVVLNNNNDHLVRQKREIDCKEESPMKLEDKQICNNGNDKPVMTKQSEEILNPNVNLNDLLPNKLPVQDMVIHHIRSLKSYRENEKR